MFVYLSFYEHFLTPLDVTHEHYFVVVDIIYGSSSWYSSAYTWQRRRKVINVDKNERNAGSRIKVYRFECQMTAIVKCYHLSFILLFNKEEYLNH